MPEDTAAPSPSPPGPTPAGFQRTTGGKGFRWEPPTPQRLAELLPQYEIECMLGHGGMGAVYKGRQKSLERTVAIKILPPGLEEEDASYIERFKNEAKVMAKFMHPAIVGVFDFGETAEGQLYIVMEYVDGTDVQKMISSQGKLPPEHALAITAHVCDALRYAHEHGVIHRDIKPANILINHEGAVKVADFGLAKAEEAGSNGLTKTGMAMGTPDYVAPEALMLGTEVDGRADLYAVGVMLYQMLTGQIPRGAWQPASVLSPGADRRFDQIITKAMQYDREARYQSSGEIRQDLDAILAAPQVQSVGGPPGSAASAQQSLPQKPTGKPPPRGAGVPPGQKPAAKAQSQPDASAPSKSKNSLVFGIGAAAALGIGVFVLLAGKKETGKAADSPPAATSSKTVSAEASARPKATQPAPGISREEPKPATVGTPRSPASKTSLSPSTEPWQNALQDPKKLSFSGKAELNAGGLHFSGSGFVKLNNQKGALQHDGAVRMFATFGSQYPSLIARDDDTQTGSYRLWAVQSRVLLMRYVAATKEMISLREFPLRESLQPGQSYELELRAVGKTLTVKYNGEALGSVTDENHSKGQFGVLLIPRESTPVLIPALEVLDLDVPAKSAPIASASAPAVSDPTISREWQPVIWEARYRAELDASLKDGWHHLIDQFTTVGELQSPQVKQMTARAFRCKVRIAVGAGIRLEQHDFYTGNHNSSQAVIRHFTSSGQITLAEADISPPVTPDKEIWIEMAACGHMLVARFDGNLIGPVHDENFSPKDHLSLSGRDVWFKDVQYRDLSGMSEAEVLKLLDVDENGHDTRGVVAQAPAKGTEPAQNAEPAKAMEQGKAAEQPQPAAADAVKAIPELQALHEQLLKLTAERVTAPFEADVAKLNAGYLGGIDRKITEETAAGHLDGVLALEAEKKLLADKQPIPASDAETTTATLKTLRGIYRTAYAKIEAARAASLKLLTDPLSLRLQTLESELTKQKRIAEAKTTREYREKLAAAPATSASPPTAAEAPPAAAKTPAAAPAPATKYPRGDDRKAAEWALSMGSRIQVLAAGSTSEPATAAALPAGKFTLTKVFLSPPNQAITSLQPLAGLKELTDLEISETDALDDADMDVLPSLTAMTNLTLNKGTLTDAVFPYLAQLRGLRSLHLDNQTMIKGEGLQLLARPGFIQFSLQGCHFSDTGYRNLGQLTQLTRLGLQQSTFTNEHLPFLEPLKKLDDLILGQTQVTLAGLAAGKAMPGLAKLGLDLDGDINIEQMRGLAARFPKLTSLEDFGKPNRAPFTPQNIAALAAFPKLNELRLRAATDADIPALMALPDLPSLGLTYCKISDAGIEALLPHKGLSRLELGFYAGSTAITDAGLLKLAEMKKLSSLKLANAKVTDAGIAALKKLRPDMTVTR